MVGLVVAFTPQKGRHIVTTRGFRAGELVLAQQPYAAVLDTDHVATHCDHCFQPHKDLLRCGRSQLARYCNRSHQKAAWNVGYKQECAALVASGAGRQPTTTMRLVARALWRAVRQRSGGEAAAAWPGTWPAPPGAWADVTQLQHHWPSLSPDTQFACAQVAAAARQFVLSAGPLPGCRGSDRGSDCCVVGLDTGGWEPDGLPGVKAIAQLVAALAANAHTLCDEELRPVGAGLYPLASLANHACTPSCLQSFEGSTISFRAVRDLAPGEEVTIAYVDLAATRQTRREALWEQYRFDVCGALPAPEQYNPPATVLRPPPLLDLTFPPPMPVLPTSGGASPADLPSIHLCVYPAGSWEGADVPPPWPCDPCDAALTRVEVVVAAAGARDSPEPLPGGVAVQLIGPRASLLDRFFETLGVQGYGSDDEEGDAVRIQPQAQQQQQQQQPVCEVLCWGPAWALPDQAWLSEPDLARATVSASALGERVWAVAAHLWRGQRLADAGQHAAAAVALRSGLAAADAMMPCGADGSRSLRLGPRHHLRLLLLAALLKVTIDAGLDWQEALQVAQKLTPIYQAVLPQHASPWLGLHFATVAKLAAFLGNQERVVMDAAGAALGVLQVTHGAGAWGRAGRALCEQVARLGWEAQQEAAARGEAQAAAM